MQNWKSLPRYLLLPTSALSIAALIIGWLDLFGFDTHQWLQVVHGIVIRWNYWHGYLFHLIGIALPIEFDLNTYERNYFIILIFIVYIPLSSITSQALPAQKKNIRTLLTVQGIIGAILGLVVVWFSAAILAGALNNAIAITIASIFLLLFGLFVIRVFRRIYFNALLFIIFFLLSLELIRLIPNAQPYIDSFQNWVEATPTDYNN